MGRDHQTDRETVPTTRRAGRRAASLAAILALGAAGWGCDREPATPAAVSDAGRATPAEDRRAATPPSVRPDRLAAGDPADGPAITDPAGPPDPTPAPAEALPPLGPPASFFVVDGEPVRFPPARAAVKPAGEGAYDVRLFSDDPPEAMDAGYAGHSFYFEMRVVVPPGGSVADGEWSVQPASAGAVAPGGDEADIDVADRPGREVVGVANGKPDADASGLFLDGRRRVLVPVDAAAVFDPVSSDGAPDPGLTAADGRVRVRLVGTFRQWVEGQPADAAPVLLDVSATLSAARAR